MTSKITGYRELDQDTIDLINKIKLHGQVLEELTSEVKLHIMGQHRNALDNELARLIAAEPQRWAAIARTHFQEGFMALTRSVAQPTS